MFIRRLAMTVLAAGTISLSTLSAHDAKLHKGNATEGEVVSIEDSKMVVKTAKGNVNVTLNKDTKYEMGEQKVDVNHFSKGSKVAVIGTKLASGELVAKEVIMPMPGAKTAATAKGDHKH
jgi:hypothetical protein